MNPEPFKLYEILPISAIEIMKFKLKQPLPCYFNTSKYTAYLGGPGLGMVSTVWGLSIFENEISARLAVGLSFGECLT